jgi:hypothetical protein
MKPNKPANTTPIISTPAHCERCPHNPTNANIGQQIMQQISQLTPDERGQMVDLIEQIIAGGQQ